MKHEGNLKEQLRNANSKGELRSILENRGLELTAEELDQVSGGLQLTPDQISKTDALVQSGRIVQQQLLKATDPGEIQRLQAEYENIMMQIKGTLGIS